MIKIFSVIMVSCAVLLPCEVAATAKSDLRKLGMKRLKSSDEIAAKAGKVISGASYGQNGDLVSVFRIEYRKTSARGGKKILKIRRPAGGGSTNVTLKWRIRGKQFCEEAFSQNGQEVCNDKEFRLGSTCYIFHGNGSIRFVLGCPVP